MYISLKIPFSKFPRSFIQVDARVERSPKNNLPVLLLDTFALAIFSCSAIWFSKCFSRFCSMSSCCRRSRIAFLGASFRFCVPLPPNHVPHIVVAFVVLCSIGASLSGCTDRALASKGRGKLELSERVTTWSSWRADEHLKECSRNVECT